MDLTDVKKEDLPAEKIFEDEIEKEQYMTFKCADEIYGISIKYVNEIIGLSQITKIPETQDYLIGLINLRGKIIPVIDVRIRFGKEPLEYNDRTCVIVIDVKSTVIGLIVDGIDEVVAFAMKETVKMEKQLSTILNRTIIRRRRCLGVKSIDRPRICSLQRKER